MRKMLAVLIGCALIAMSVVAHAEAVSPVYELVAYDENRILITESDGAREMDAALYALSDGRAVKQWDYRIKSDSYLSALGLPAINRVVLYSQNGLVMLSDAGEVVSEMSFDGAKFSMPIVSPGRKAAVMFGRDRERFLLIDADGAKAIPTAVEGERYPDVAVMMQKQMPVLLDDDGRLYVSAERADGYWWRDVEGHWTLIEGEGALLCVAADGAWTLNKRMICFPDGQRLELPKPRGKYQIQTWHHGGAIIIDEHKSSLRPHASLIINGRDRQFGTWKSTQVDGFTLASADMRYLLNPSTWDDDGPELHGVWVNGEGGKRLERKIMQMVSPSYNLSGSMVLMNDGGALCLGEGEDEGSFGLWRLDMHTGEYTLIPFA